MTHYSCFPLLSPFPDAVKQVSDLSLKPTWEVAPPPTPPPLSGRSSLGDDKSGDLGVFSLFLREICCLSFFLPILPSLSEGVGSILFLPYHPRLPISPDSNSFVFRPRCASLFRQPGYDTRRSVLDQNKEGGGRREREGE